MNRQLMVMTFRRHNRAETVLKAIRTMRKSPVLCLANVVVATRNRTGEIKIRSGREPVTSQPDGDTQRLLVLADLILCAPDQDAVHALINRGMDGRFVSEIARNMEGESSALFVLAHENSVHDAGETRRALALFRGMLHQTSFPPDVEAYLSERWVSNPEKVDVANQSDNASTTTVIRARLDDADHDRRSEQEPKNTTNRL